MQMERESSGRSVSMEPPEPDEAVKCERDAEEVIRPLNQQQQVDVVQEEDEKVSKPTTINQGSYSSLRKLMETVSSGRSVSMEPPETDEVAYSARKAEYKRRRRQRRRRKARLSTWMYA